MFMNLTPECHPLHLRALEGFVKSLNLVEGREVANFNASKQDSWVALIDSKFVLSPPGIIIKFFPSTN